MKALPKGKGVKPLHRGIGEKAFVRRAISRQKFLKLTGAGLAGAALLGAAGCGGGTSAAGNRLVFVSYGGSYQEAEEKAWIRPFFEKNGVEVVQDSPTDYAKLRAMVENEQTTWDVVDMGDEDFGPSSSFPELFEPLDYSVIDASSIPEGQVEEYRVASMLYGSVLAYSTEQLGDAPKNWADFFDLEKFPGKRGLRKAPTPTLEIALMGDGVPPGDVYPIDVDRAFAKLDTVKGEAVYWETGSQSAQQLADGEVAMSAAWNGRVQTAIDAGAPLEIQWNQYMANIEYLVVPKGAPNKERAMELIAYITSAENNHRISDFIPYAPVNKESIDKVDPEVAPRLPIYKDRESNSLAFNKEWWDENRDEVTERFNEWLLG